jgi:hypothetical protein
MNRTGAMSSLGITWVEGAKNNKDLYKRNLAWYLPASLQNLGWADQGFAHYISLEKSIYMWTWAFHPSLFPFPANSSEENS